MRRDLLQNKLVCLSRLRVLCFAFFDAHCIRAHLSQWLMLQCPKQQKPVVLMLSQHGYVKQKWQTESMHACTLHKRINRMNTSQPVDAFSMPGSKSA